MPAPFILVFLPYLGVVRILGIDPGLKITGYGVIDSASGRNSLIDGGVIRLNPRASLSERLAELESQLEQLFTEFSPDICAVEQLYAHYNHPRTAILMGHARGIILLVAQKRAIRMEQFAANRIKQSLTGHGHAGKPQMQRAIQAEFNLASIPQPPDVADALAIALCCARSIDRGPLAIPKPKRPRRRLLKTAP